MQTPFRRGNRRVAAVKAVSTIIAPLCVGMAATLPTPAWAQQASSSTNANGQQLVSLDVRDAQVQEAISMLTRQSGIQNIVYDNPGDKPFKKVTLALKDKPVDFILRTVASAAGASVTLENGIYYIRPREDAPKAQTMPAGDTGAIAVTAPVRRKSIIAKLQLNYISGRDFIYFVDTPGAASILNEVGNGVPASVANPYPAPLKPLTVDMGLGQPAPASEERPATTGGGLGAGQNDATLSSAGARGFGGQGNFGGFQGGLGGQQGGPGGQGGQQGGNRATLRPEDIQTIVSSDADNTLIVKSASPEGIEELRTIIRLLDVAPRQVQIKAEFVQVSIADADGFGIDWRIAPSPNTDVATSALGNGASLTAAYASGNAVANLRTAATRNTTNLLQAPIVSTLNNKLATLTFQDSAPIFSTVQTIGPGGAIANSTISQPIVATNGFFVTPHINGDNSITMALTPTLQSNSNVTGPNGATAVRTTTQSVSAIRRIQSGETMVIGGFITNQVIRSENNVPFLSKLPIIGGLFKSYDRQVSGTETLIFVTPTIIEDRSQGVVGPGAGSGSNAPAPTP